MRKHLAHKNQVEKILELGNAIGTVPHSSTGHLITKVQSVFRLPDVFLRVVE